MSVWIRKRLRKPSPREPHGGPSYIVLFRRGGRSFPVESARTFRTQREAKLRQKLVADWLAEGKNPKLELDKFARSGRKASPQPRKSVRQTRSVLSPDTPYGNLLALRELIRAAREWLCWWDQHLPGKVLEVLYDELDGERVNVVRLLSGPDNITDRVKRDFERFHREMEERRGIDVTWRVLPKGEASRHHDRFFISQRMSRNLPPFNTILRGGTGEILPSRVSRREFDRWWRMGTDLADFPLKEAA